MKIEPTIIVDSREQRAWKFENLPSERRKTKQLAAAQRWHDLELRRYDEWQMSKKPVGRTRPNY